MVHSPDEYRAVADSNVIIAAHRSPHSQSPNRDLIERWRLGEYDFLYSTDTLAEYAEKLLALDVARSDVVAFLALVSMLGEEVEIRFFHLPRYPHDPDDIAFLLCARNGLASHLVSYDEHLPFCCCFADPAPRRGFDPTAGPLSELGPHLCWQFALQCCRLICATQEDLPMTSTTVRVSEPTHRTLRELSEQLDESMQGILDRAIEDYRRKRLLERANAAYAALRGNPEAWKDEQAEREVWEATLSDGLDDE
jgi:uncharacterized protein